MSERVERAVSAWVVALLVALSSLLLGCNAARVFIASPGDYEEYRRVRLGNTLGERLAAARDYLKRYPKGRYADRLRGYYAYAEPLYFANQEKKGPEGIEEYLRHLPNSKRSKDASEMLAQLRNEQRREAVETRRVKAVTGRLSEEKRARALAARLPVDWTIWLSDPEAFDKVFSKVPTRLLIPYRLQLPQPTCSKRPWGRRCIKTIVRRFRLRAGAEVIDQELEITVRVDLDSRWRMLAARIAGEDMLQMSYEAHNHRQLESDEGDPGEALSESFFSRLMPALLDEKRSCSRIGRRLSCGATVVELKQEDELDSITIFRGTPPADDDAEEDSEEDSDEDSDEDSEEDSDEANKG